MPVKIIIVGDTHARFFKDLPNEMIDEIQEADRVSLYQHSCSKF